MTEKNILDIKDENTLNFHRKNSYKKNLNRRGIKSKYHFSMKNMVFTNKPFYIDLDKFVSFEGSYYNYTKDPLVKTALELIEDENIEISETYLYKFCQNFIPKNYGEAHGVSENNKLCDLQVTSFFHPWEHARPTNIFRGGLWGPKHITSTELRIIRLKNLINNIREFGYIPSYNDIVEGKLLIKDNDYRFQITGGHHRVAVLLAMNKKGLINLNKILVKLDFARGKNNVIRKKEVINWPAVKSNYLSTQDASDFFESFFQID